MRSKEVTNFSEFFKTNDLKLFLNFSPVISDPSGCNDTQTVEQKIRSIERGGSNFTQNEL